MVLAFHQDVRNLGLLLHLMLTILVRIQSVCNMVI